MCGRFALQATAEDIAAYFDVEAPQQFVSRYNIAPTTPVLAKTDTGLTFFSWGLVPSWARDVNIGSRMFNARAETVATKPSFRNAFKRRRCLVPASGFYEWKAEPGGKQPYYCHLNHRLFSFAAIWEHWQDSMGNELQTCAILTTDACGEMRQVHERMPVVIRDEHRDLWLDLHDEEIDRAMACIAAKVDDFEVYPVSKKVNAARNDSPDLINHI